MMVGAYAPSAAWLTAAIIGLSVAWSALVSTTGLRLVAELRRFKCRADFLVRDLLVAD